MKADFVCGWPVFYWHEATVKHGSNYMSSVPDIHLDKTAIKLVGDMKF